MSGESATKTAKTRIPRGVNNTWVCEECGKNFKRPPSGVNKHPFCSVECSRAWQKKHNPKGAQHHQYRRVKVICDWCGTEYETKPSLAARGKKHYCSSECQHKGATADIVANSRRTAELIETTCAWCGKPIKRHRSQLERSTPFCSFQCRSMWYSEHYAGENSPHWRGGKVHHYPDGWVTVSRAIRNRDGNRCVACGSTENLQVHHIIPYSECNEHDENNLITLCAHCHSQITSNDEIIPQGAKWDCVRTYVASIQNAALFSIGGKRA